jgi:di/tricarboxylate transporter
MDPQILLLLLVLAGATVFFSFEIVPADVVALSILVILILTGLLSAEEAFAGFGSSTFILLLGLLILTAALTRTGVVETAGRWILRRTSDNVNHLTIMIMLSTAGLSSFMSNTASTAFFLPVVLGIARRLRVSASKLLLPLAFASILASSVTLISTSTNIVISGLMTNYGMPRMGIFELTPVGIPILLAGIAYMYFIGRRLIPNRADETIDLDELANAPYVTEIVVMPESPLSGQTLEEAGLGRDMDLNVIRIVRNTNRYITPTATTKLEESDILLVEGSRDDLLKVKDVVGIEFKADAKFVIPENGEEEEVHGGIDLVELLIVPGSSLIGRTLRGTEFRERYGVQVLAINRHGETLRRKISQTTLRLGDVLLVQGAVPDLAGLDLERNFRMLGAVKTERPNWRRAPLAIAIFLGSLLAATFGLVSLPVAVLIGSVLVFITRCITPEEAYREVRWDVLLLIGSMLAIGEAMENTGTAVYLSGLIVGAAGDAAPFWLLSGFFILTVLLTQPMSNQAAAVVVLPVAVQTALQLGLNPRSFVMTIALAASCSYLTPLEPSCLMVYGPGNYRFTDFLKVGSLLTLVVYGITMVMVPIVWPLDGG